MAETRPFIVVFSFFAISGLALAQEQPDKPTGEPSSQTAQQPPEQRGQQRPGVERPYKGDDFPYASYMLGYILAKKGEFESAASQLRHFVKINEKAPEVGQVKTHRHSGRRKAASRGSRGTDR